ncbi:hypothetical protein CASFOL_034382 [Castilleja foliolosa]|uniref:Calreticulin n=1 Tax=Castilleja foliolosa TaxID=1961234 RepID=A0ABD3BYL5_9LAMI
MADEKWMQAASKYLKEEAAAASEPDEKWPPSKWTGEIEPKPDESDEKPDESDEKWMKATSKYLEEEAAASKSDDAKWPASKCTWLEEPEPSNEGQAEGNPVKRQKNEADEGDV